jgi:4-diphosphocytidyl-2-C-methyl-D-erythritol kinase
VSAAERRLRLRAPAKVNLGLRVVGRRADGYHEIDSLLAPLELADEIELRLLDGAGESRLELAGAPAGVPSGTANLALRAACAFVAEAGGAWRVELRLHKRIPPAAGLGGGSSDAGAVLRGLRELLPGALGPERLGALALGLGADVPFFLDPRPALAQGIGERLAPVAGLPALPLLLASPGVELPTRAVYQVHDALAPALTPHPPSPTIDALFRLGGRGGRPQREALRELLANDLEPAATKICPAIAQLRLRLEGSDAIAVGMSGSGATVFGVFEDERAAAEAARELARPAADPRAAGLWTVVTRTLASPES